MTRLCVSGVSFSNARNALSIFSFERTLSGFRSAHGGGSTGNPFSITITAPAVGNLMVVEVGIESPNNRTISSITDNATGGSNTYAPTVPATQRIRAGAGTVEIWTARVERGGATSVTITLSGAASFVDGFVHEYSGVASVKGGFNNGGSGTTLTISVTSDQANAMIVTCLSDTAGTAASITITVGQNGDTNTNVPAGTANATNAAAGATLTVTGTMGTSGNWDAVAIELFGATGGYVRRPLPMRFLRSPKRQPMFTSSCLK